MLRQALGRALSDRHKRALKTKLNGARQLWVKTFLHYNGDQLKAAVRQLGLADTDTVLVHSNFEPDSGFEGTPLDLVNVLESLFAVNGNLLMVSIPFRGSAYDYLKSYKTFNVRKTLSMMGLVTEMFRRKPQTVRSLHPTHPVLASGPDSAWFVAGHEECLYPCGPQTPFEKLLEKNGQILFFDVGLEAITFFHYVEHLLKDELPFPVYSDEMFTVGVVDADGRKREMKTYAYSKTPRRADKLYEEMSRQGKVRRARIGNSRLLLVTAEDVVSCQSAMVRAGRYPYEV
jgi:aminoglycoside 3-N-acetyltransferase